MGDISTRIMSNDYAGFYAVMGPFLSRHAIVAELGFPVWDDDGKTWFVLLDAGRVVGFSALRPDGHSVVLCSAYVLPEHRRQGLYRRMIIERIAYARERGVTKLTTTATEQSRPALEAAGFRALRTTGRYTKMEMDL